MGEPGPPVVTVATVELGGCGGDSIALSNESWTAIPVVGGITRGLIGDATSQTGNSS